MKHVDSPEAVAQADIYSTALQVVELHEEQGRGPVCVFSPEEAIRHGFSSDTAIWLYAAGDTVGGSTPEFSTSIPQMRFEVNTLQQPVAAYGRTGMDLFRSIMEARSGADPDMHTPSSSDIGLVAWSDFTVPHPRIGGMKALQKSPAALQEDISSLDVVQLNRLIDDYTAQSRGSRELQAQMGLDSIPLGDAYRLLGLVSGRLQILRTAGGVDAAEARFGARASQEQMRSLWKAAQDLLHITTELVIPRGIRAYKYGFEIRNQFAEAEGGEVARQRQFSYQDAARAGEPATRLSIGGPVQMHKEYAYSGYRSGYKTFLHPAMLHLNFPHIKGGTRTYTMRESSLSGVMTAKVDGTIPRRDEDGVGYEGRHLTAAECSDLQLVMHSLEARNMRT